MISARAASKKNAVMIAAITCSAVVILLVAILAPVIAYLVNPYRDYDSVIARFRLSNGMTLEYVIDEQEYDIAATNFIFLAKSGYFDNTVFFDAQNGWLRFGGYESQPALSATSSSDYNSTHHHAQNSNYVYNFKGISNSRFEDPDAGVNNYMNKFGYKLRSDSKGTNQQLLNEIGVLAFLYSDTSTEFQFSYRTQAVNDIVRKDSSGKESNDTLTPTMVGHALDDKTIENLVSISETSALNTAISSGYLWKPPTPNVYINSVRVYNLDKKKWKDFDFVEYVYGNDSNGSRRLNYWTGIV